MVEPEVVIRVAADFACGGDDSVSTADPAGDSTPATSSGPATGEGGDDSGSANVDLFDCPLSAEQGSEVLGADLEKDDATCTYSRSDGGPPYVAFFVSVPEACTE